MQEWSKRLAEVAANFLVPGLGGLIFDKANRKNALWLMVLSVAGMVLAVAGSGVFIGVFVDSSGLRLDEEYVSEVLQKPEELYRMMLGLGGVIFGGVLILGGFLWSLENAMKRWRNLKSPASDVFEISESK